MKDKVIVVVGPTASGKTGVGIELAKRLDGEVVSADSRAIYKEMSIGTAKPTIEEMDGVRHWGIGLVCPDERFTVADYQEYARDAIKDIVARGKVPIIVGGTGLYVDALVYDYQFNSVVKNTQSDRKKVNKQFIQYGILVDREVLRARITTRIDTMFCDELYDETKKLAQRYSWDLQAMKSDIYPIIWKYLNGGVDIDEAKRLAVHEDMYLAKRQMTWFRRNKQIRWLEREVMVEQILSDVAVKNM